MTAEMFEEPRVVQGKVARRRSGWRSGYEASQRSKKPFAPWRYQPCQCEMCGEVLPTASYQDFCPKCDFCRGCCACREGRRPFLELKKLWRSAGVKDVEGVGYIFDVDLLREKIKSGELEYISPKSRVEEAG